VAVVMPVMVEARMMAVPVVVVMPVRAALAALGLSALLDLHACNLRAGKIAACQAWSAGRGGGIWAGYNYANSVISSGAA
jgi:hypothetical protein